MVLCGPHGADHSNIQGAKTKVVNGMLHFGSTLRGLIPVTSTPLPAPLHYQGGNSCLYDVVWNRVGASELKGPLTIGTAAVRDRIAITERGFGALSSLLVSSTGAVTNYNVVDPFTHRRITASNMSTFADELRRQMSQAYPNAGKIGMLISQPMIPRLVDNDGTVGAKVAVLDGLDGEWATYYYQGMTQYKQYSGAVLDLIKTSFLNGKEVTERIGFPVVEYRTMMPLVFVFENFDQLHATVQNCD